MKVATVELEGIAPYGQSKYHNTPKLDKEIPKDYEARTWRERMHIDENGEMFIPPMAFKNCLSECAKYMSVQIPGKGKATYTKHFEAGMLVMEPVCLGIKKEDVSGLWLFVPSDGKRGGGKRVEKCFPVVQKWKGTVRFYIIDETVTEEVFKYHLESAGNFIGVGFFRPRNNGYYGRFKVNKITWSEE